MFIRCGPARAGAGGDLVGRWGRSLLRQSSFRKIFTWADLVKNLVRIPDITGRKRDEEGRIRLRRGRLSLDPRDDARTVSARMNFLP